MRGELERGRGEMAHQHLAGERREIGRILQLHHQRARCRRLRIELEGGRHDDAEAAERPGEQARQIVARDVLHDDAATFGQKAVGSDEFDADDQIARSAVPVTPRPAVVGGHEAPDRRAIGGWRIERNPLTVRGERAIHIRERRAGLNRRREIAVAMRDDGIELRGGQQHINRTRRRSPAKLRARSPRQNGQLLARGPRQKASYGIDGRRLDDDARHDTFDGICGRAEANTGAADESDGGLQESFRHWSSRLRRIARSCSCWRSLCRQPWLCSRGSWPSRPACTRSRSADRCARGVPRPSPDS